MVGADICVTLLLTAAGAPGNKIKVPDMAGAEALTLAVKCLPDRSLPPEARVLWQIGRLDGQGGGLCPLQKVLRDDGTYQNGGYWATPLAWFMDTVMRLDAELAARTFPAIQPGNVTAGAGAVVRVLFRLATVPPEARLYVGLLWDEGYRTAPAGLEVRLNRQRGAVAIPCTGGNGRGPGKDWPALVAFRVPAGVLKAGENELLLTVPGTSPWRYDGVVLATGVSTW